MYAYKNIADSLGSVTQAQGRHLHICIDVWYVYTYISLYIYTCVYSYTNIAYSLRLCHARARRMCIMYTHIYLCTYIHMCMHTRTSLTPSALSRKSNEERRTIYMCMDVYYVYTYTSLYMYSYVYAYTNIADSLGSVRQEPGKSLHQYMIRIHNTHMHICTFIHMFMHTRTLLTTWTLSL